MCGVKSGPLAEHARTLFTRLLPLPADNGRVKLLESSADLTVGLRRPHTVPQHLTVLFFCCFPLLFAVCCDAGSFQDLYCLVIATVTVTSAVALAPQQSLFTKHEACAERLPRSSYAYPPLSTRTRTHAHSLFLHPHTDTHNGFGAANMAALAGREHRPEVRTDYEQGPIGFPSTPTTSAAA